MDSLRQTWTIWGRQRAKYRQKLDRHGQPSREMNNMGQAWTAKGRYAQPRTDKTSSGQARVIQFGTDMEYPCKTQTWTYWTNTDN